MKKMKADNLLGKVGYKKLKYKVGDICNIVINFEAIFKRYDMYYSSKK